MATFPGKAQEAKDFISAKFGYDMKDIALVHEAIDTTGLNTMYSSEANKRLAMLGDKALEVAIISSWYPTGASRGDCNARIQSKLRNKNMAEVAQQMGLDHYLILHPGQANHAILNTLAT